jgi:hypothetical protein
MIPAEKGSMMKRFLFLASAFAAGFSSASAHVDFTGVFAPSETWVKAPEKPLRDDICLNGSWQFEPVTLPDSYKEGVDPTPELPPVTDDGWDKVPLKVPSPWNVNSFADSKGLGGDFHTYPSYPQSWETVKMGWIRRNFTVPAAWKGRRILIHIGAAAGDLHFLVNGKDAGSKFDVFFPFDVDVTDLVQYGASNELLIGVRKPELFDVRGKYGHRTWQGGSFWGQQVVGIWQDIDLVAVPVVRVSDVFVQPLIDQDTLKAQVTLHNDGDAPATVSVSGQARQWISLAAKDAGYDPAWKLGDTPSLSLPAASITVPAHGDQTVTLQQKVGTTLQTWTPDHPNLYGLLVDVSRVDQSQDDHLAQLEDIKYTRFGWRQFSFQGAQMMLNGQPIVMKGDSWHFLGIPQMTRRYPWAWFTALHDAHLNAVRLHAEPYPPFYLDVADEMGIMVLDETAIWASDGGPKLDSDAFWKDTEAHVHDLVMRDRSHPSVFGWSVCNEVHPIVVNVFHNPPGMLAKLLSYYTIWADIVHQLDPTRQWISADGDGDGEGKLPTNMIHYGGEESMKGAVALGKPWGVGETTGAYYMTPQQVAKELKFGERAYESFEGRMEGIAKQSYEQLMLQRQYNGDYRSVFNLVWYGLQPLPLGLPDETKVPTLDDGIFFPPLVEGQPGVQPERLGPYCTTLNPGYDPSLPLYKPWPMFTAIKDASAEPPVPFTADAAPTTPQTPAATPTPVQSIDLQAGSGSELKTKLTSMGVPFDDLKSSGTAQILFIDGIHPPDDSVKQEMNSVLGSGGTVVVWGVSQGSLPQLNALLPAALELTDRQASSLVTAASDPVVAGLVPSMMYFTELSPPTILDAGLGGPLVTQGTVLLQAANPDWARWNGKAEFAKTSSIVRSEREAKPSGAALVEIKQGSGRLLICNLPAASGLVKGQTLTRTILANLGIPLKAAQVVGDALAPSGDLIGAVGLGRFPDSDSSAVDPTRTDDFKVGTAVDGKKWGRIAAEGGAINMNQNPPFDGPGSNCSSYLSFWVFSPISLTNLLLNPNLPKVDLTVETQDSVTIYLNGTSVGTGPENGGNQTKAKTLPFEDGWNNILVRVTRGAKGDEKLKVRLNSNQGAFLGEIKSALQKPQQQP